MSESVSATELAKLGKCAALIRTRSGVSRSGIGAQPRYSAAIERGIAAHVRYELIAQEHMSDESLRDRRSARTAVNVAIAFAVFWMLAILIR